MKKSNLAIADVIFNISPWVEWLIITTLPLWFGTEGPFETTSQLNHFIVFAAEPQAGSLYGDSTFSRRVLLERSCTLMGIAMEISG